MFFTEEMNKIALSSNNDERIPSTDLTGTYECGTKKKLLVICQVIKYDNIMKQQKND